jgi:hypothetical protein
LEFAPVEACGEVNASHPRWVAEKSRESGISLARIARIARIAKKNSEALNSEFPNSDLGDLGDLGESFPGSGS